MAWFLNFYKCGQCRRRWTDEWRDDQCPSCGFRDMTPYKTDDLTELVEREGDEFIVLRSPDTAELRGRLLKRSWNPTIPDRRFLLAA